MRTAAYVVCVLVLLAHLGPTLAQVCNLGGVRFDCCPGGCSQQTCQQNNGCCWSPITPNGVDASRFNHTDAAPDNLKGIPWCFHPNPTIQGYVAASVTPTPYGFEAILKNVAGKNVYGSDISPVQVSVYFETQTRLRVKIFDPSNKRWEVPNVVKVQTPSQRPPVMDYSFSWTTSPFGFAITRKSTGDVIFNTTSPSSGWMFNGLVFEDQYLEISTQMSSNANVYGLGERIHPFRLDNSGKYYTIFATDIGTPYNINLYGSHPFYMELKNSSTSPRTVAAHGVFLLNSNGMDVYLGPGQLTYKTIGGILDFYFFLGPTPANVIEQYTEVIGRPYMPPYWALGWHQCRYGYHTLQDVETVVQMYAENNLPLDTIWTDIDYMDNYYDFTWDPVRFPVSQVQSFLSQLHANNQQYIVITDCGIPTDNSYAPWVQGLEMDIFIKDNTGNQPFVGKVWPGLTGWVDWTHPNATVYWTNQIRTFLQSTPLDGLWIDMNEISNFCDGPCSNQAKGKQPMKALSDGAAPSFDPNNPPYPINNRGSQQPLNQKTISMDAIHYASLEYNTHNLFGYGEGNATTLALESIRGKRAVVISRSTFPGHGYRAAHWLGDNTSDWPDLYYAIPGILNFQLFGIPLVGADICGFNGATTEELCARWMEVGAFYPFSRNHNSINMPPQEPYVWPLVANISRQILGIKYSVLPYYYTLFHHAHVNGSTVARPLLFEFPDDINTLGIDQQFLIGPGLLITPVLTQGATSVVGYFPRITTGGRWYDFYTYQQLQSSGSGWINLDAPIYKLPLHVRGGVTIPMQQPSLTTAASRQNPYSLLVALSQFGNSSGDLYLDEGDGLNTLARGAYTYVSFLTQNKMLKSTVQQNGYVPLNLLRTVTVLGVSTCPQTVTVNGGTNGFTFSCNQATKALVVAGLQLQFNAPFSLSWN